MTRTMNPPSRRSAGFTLIELLVVLLILAILTTVAVQSVDGVQEQSSYDATRRIMPEVENAIIGSEGARDYSGGPLVTGFVADMGRLPKAQLLDHDNNALTPPLLQPLELWGNPFATSFAIRDASAANLPAPQAALADNAVKVPCGWRGPYLRLPMGTNVLRDGWGNAFKLLKKNRDWGDLCEPDEEIEMICSLGSDNSVTAVPTDDYREDIYLNLRTDAVGTYPPASASNRSEASFIVTVKKSDGSGPATGTAVELRMFGPNPDTGLVKATSFPAQTSVGDPLEFIIPLSAIGPRVLRAYAAGTPNSAPLQITIHTLTTNIPLIWKGP